MIAFERVHSLYPPIHHQSVVLSIKGRQESPVESQAKVWSADTGGNQRQITTSFLFVKPSKRTIMLMDAWAASLSSSAYVDDSAALQLLLQRAEYATLNVGVFATPLFPNLGEHTNTTSADLKVGTFVSQKSFYCHTLLYGG